MFKKTLAIISLLIVTAVFTSSGFGQNSPAQDYTLFKDSKYQFSVSFPKGWNQKPKDPDPTIRLEATSEKTGGGPSFIIQVIPVKGSEKIRAEEFVNVMLDPKMLNQLATTMSPILKVVSSGKTYLGSNQAFFLISEGNSPHGLMTVYQIQTLHQGHIVTLTFGSLKSDFGKYFLSFEETAASFEFSPAKTTFSAQK